MHYRYHNSILVLTLCIPIVGKYLITIFLPSRQVLGFEYDSIFPAFLIKILFYEFFAILNLHIRFGVFFKSSFEFTISCPKAYASSSAKHPPCPIKGTIGCAASPRRVKLPKHNLFTLGLV